MICEFNLRHTWISFNKYVTMIKKKLNCKYISKSGFLVLTVISRMKYNSKLCEF